MPTIGPSKITAEQLAERWQVSTAHVRRLARTHRLPSVKIGRVLRFDVADVLAYETAHRQAAQPEPRSRRGGSRRA